MDVPWAKVHVTVPLKKKKSFMSLPRHHIIALVLNIFKKEQARPIVHDTTIVFLSSKYWPNMIHALHVNLIFHIALLYVLVLLGGF